jgi:hypothetical protein
VLCLAPLTAIRDKVTLMNADRTNDSSENEGGRS